jgi:hypothetical protein
MSPVVFLHGFIGGVATLSVTAGLFSLSLVVIRFDRAWPSWLLLIGAGAAFIAISSDFLLILAFDRGWLRSAGLLDGDALSSAVAIPLKLIELVSFCIPAALLWYCVRAVRLGLTNRALIAI